MKAIIFLGPSMSHDEARNILDADYRPPVKRGDLIPIYSENDVIVGIIDGVLLNESAVGHREILGLLERGITVVGGGSMGALRASELKDFGMIGVGEIFEMYSSGVIEGDDEVAIVFNPETLEPLSEALINIRYNLERAASLGIISWSQSEDIIHELKSIYFPQRSYEKALEIAYRKLKENEFDMLREYLVNSAKDLKKSDAKLVITTIKNLIYSKK